MVDINDPFLIVIAVVVPLVLIAINLLFVLYFIQLPPAGFRGCADYTTMTLLILCLLIAECTVLLLPLDVANRSGIVGCGFWNNECGGLDLTLVWQIVYIIVAALVVVVIPYAIFYYENLENAPPPAMAGKPQPRGTGQCCGCPWWCCCLCNCISGTVCCCASVASSAPMVAACYTSIVLVIAGGLMGVGYVFLSDTAIPVSAVQVDVGDSSVWFNPTDSFDPQQACGTGSCSFVETDLVLQVSFVVFVGALISFVGWFLFALYGGIGMVGIPFDNVVAFTQRPRVKTTGDRVDEKKSLTKEAKELVSMGSDLGREIVEEQVNIRGRAARIEAEQDQQLYINRYRVLVMDLEERYETLRLSDEEARAETCQPMTAYCQLLCGILGVPFLLVWIIHICLYMLVDPPVHPFLNRFFTFFDTYASFIGTIVLGVLAMYLLASVLKGNAKFGSRFFLIKIHPMVKGKTLPNSFFFNVGLVMLCCIPVVQFCTEAFADYARLTDANQIFGYQIRYMQFFKYFFQYRVFIYMLLAMNLLTCIYLALWPSDREHLKKVRREMRRNIKREVASTQKRLESRGGQMAGMSAPVKNW